MKAVERVAQLVGGYRHRLAAILPKFCRSDRRLSRGPCRLTCALMIYWLHVAGTLSDALPARRHRLPAWRHGPHRWCCRSSRAAICNRATDNMRQVLGPHADPREARRLTRAAFVNYVALHDRPGAPAASRAARADREHAASRAGSTSTRRSPTARAWSSPPATSATGTWPAPRSPRAAIRSARWSRRSNPPRWNERVQRTRIAAGVKAIPIETGLRDMIAALRKREGLAVLVDRPVAEDGVAVTFFGRGDARARRRGDARPAHRTRRWCRRCWCATRTARLPGPHRRRPSSAHRGDDAAMVMQRVMSWLEGIIRRYPDQWFMFRQMWPSPSRPPFAAQTVALDLLIAYALRLAARAPAGRPAWCRATKSPSRCAAWRASCGTWPRRPRGRPCATTCATCAAGDPPGAR